ncbi:MAG TPA: hypothetical protein VL327_02245 [Pyrinomonadaceae bacterium]|jgi:hypothetical protein|nr:hypothetical protein [Pyrinomonadaceae bacterium]
MEIKRAIFGHLRDLMDLNKKAARNLRRGVEEREMKNEKGFRLSRPVQNCLPLCLLTVIFRSFNKKTYSAGVSRNANIRRQSNRNPMSAILYSLSHRDGTL